MSILITGGTGFTGAEIVRQLLAEDEEARAFPRDERGRNPEAWLLL
jgi:uncharacterized protein YbjT (DUF2867 family)